MTVRLYLVPIEQTATAAGGVLRGPKYFAYRGDPDAPALLDGVNWDMADFGLEPTALLAADVTPAQHTTLAANADVTAIPANLDASLGANLAAVQSALESLHIPADALVAGATYRQVVRGILAIFAFAQRFDGNRGGRLFPAGLTLATTLGDLSAAARAQLQTAASQLGYTLIGVTLASSLRDVLKTIATQTAPGTLLGTAI